MCGESADVDEKAVDEWFQQLPHILRDYEPEDIFNVDETGLFYKLLPAKTLAYRKERCYGGKTSKERISVLVGANSTGTEKLKLLVIGKSRKPRCFAKNQKLPVHYYANKKAWMTGSIFEKHMMELDKKFNEQNRSVLFLIDNCSAHPKTVASKLKSIKLVFFPPNMTSKVQPMDAGIIKNVKVNYRVKVVNNLIEKLENCSHPKLMLNVLNAITYLSQAWNDVKPTTIRNCFKHVGIASPWDDEDDMPLSLLKNIIDQQEPINDAEAASDSINIENWDRIRLAFNLDFTFGDYVSVDRDIPTVDLPSDDEVIGSLSSDNTVIDDDDVDYPAAIEAIEDIAPVTLPDPNIMRASLRNIYNALRSNLFTPSNVMECFAVVETHILTTT